MIRFSSNDPLLEQHDAGDSPERRSSVSDAVVLLKLLSWTKEDGEMLLLMLMPIFLLFGEVAESPTANAVRARVFTWAISMNML